MLAQPLLFCGLLGGWFSTAWAQNLEQNPDHNLNHSLNQSLMLTVDDTELTIHRVAVVKSVKPLARVVWLPSEYGVLPQERKIAEQLALQGIESWFVDFYESLFLAPTLTAVDEIPPAWTAALVDLAKHDNLPLWVIAPNKAAQTVLRGLQRFLAQPHNHLGVILINPNLYLNTPEPGLAAHYWPEVSNSNVPLTILQAELSPWRWRVMDLAAQLQKGGSDVFVKLLPKVRDRYYFRPDALGIEQQSALQLSNEIIGAMALQLPYLPQNRQVKALQARQPLSVQETRATELRPYKGQQGLTIHLADMHHQRVDLQDYQGKVVLLNFWASWCPPCVHELPSMARLKSRYPSQAFEIVAVNLGEERGHIDSFLTEHPVNFPVLLDTQGQAVRDWQVFAYPSSYLIDKKGQIREALFGATDWEGQSHIEKIDRLLAE